MTDAVVLRSPDGTIVRRSVDSTGRWAEPTATPDRVTGEGWWALPGLVDAHAHLAAARLDYEPGNLVEATDRARKALAAGVTLILDKGWTDDTTIRLIDSVPDTERPDIEAAARILTSPDGYMPGFAVEVDGESLPEAARTEGVAGRGWVKLIGDWPRRGVGPVSNFTEEQLGAVVAIAESLGSKVAIHTMARDVPSAAVRAGVHSIEHGLFLEPDDLDSLGVRSGMWVPTILRAEAVVAQLGAGSTGGKLLVEGLTNVSALLSDAVDAGVHVLAGTDLVGSPADVAAEALKLGEYGLSPHQMVHAVSGAGLIATGRPVAFDLGTPADAVFYSVNPVEEPTVLAFPELVVRKGRFL